MEPKLDSQRIKELMEARGISAWELAKRAHLHSSHPYRLLTESRPNTTAVTVAKIAEALQTTSEYLLGLTDDASPPGPDRSHLTALEWRILELFRLLPTWLQEVAIRQLDVWLDHRDGWEGETNSADDDATEE